MTSEKKEVKAYSKAEVGEKLLTSKVLNFQGAKAMQHLHKYVQALSSDLHTASGTFGVESASQPLQLRVTGGPSNDFGAAPTIYTFAPLEILYVKLQIDLQPMQYTYLYGSGIYRWAGDPAHQVNLNDFMTGYRNGDLSTAPNLAFAQNLYNTAGIGGPPHIVVKKQCYVVLELNSSANLFFCENAKGISTDDSNAGDDYCALTHYDINGMPSTTSQAPASCTLLSFAVENPNKDDRLQDQYNLYLQMGTISNATFLTVDPFIKNRGGPPPH